MARSIPAVEFQVQAMADEVWSWCETTQVFGRTVTIKVKFADFRLVTRSRSHRAVVISREHLRRASIDLVQSLFPPAKGIRLVGVTVSNLNDRSAASEDGLPLFAAATMGTGQTGSVLLLPAGAS